MNTDKQTNVITKCEELYGLQFVAFVRFLLSTGTRTSEAFKLVWDDVDFEDGTVLFRKTKSHEDRFVPVTPQLRSLDDLRRLQVQTLQDGGPFRKLATDRRLHDKLKRVINATGIDHFTFHDLRRTCLTQLALGGLAPAVLQCHARRKNVDTMMTYYVAVTDQDVKRLVLKAASV